MKISNLSIVFFSLVMLFGCSESNKEHTHQVAVAKESPEEAAKHRELVAVYLGKKVPYDQFEKIGYPQTLSGTDNNQWVAYFPKADFTIISDKETDFVKAVFVGKRG